MSLSPLEPRERRRGEGPARRLDVLFVNAGIGYFRPLAELEEAGFDRSIAVNVKGPLFLIQALLPILANPASIILNTSINNRIGMPNTTVYAATKAGLASLIRTLSGELISRGIRVNAVSPGPTATPMHDKLGLVGEHLDALVAQIPAGRRGDPSEIAKAVVFLASDESPFTVGCAGDGDRVKLKFTDPCRPRRGQRGPGGARESSHDWPSGLGRHPSLVASGARVGRNVRRDRGMVRAG